MYSILFRDYITEDLQVIVIKYFTYIKDYYGESGLFLLSVDEDEIFIKDISVSSAELLILNLYQNNKLDLSNYFVKINEHENEE